MGNRSFSGANLAENQVQGPSSQDWVLTQGAKFLEETTKRLGIDTHKYTYKESVITNLSIYDLNQLKKHVKNELKRYDQTFVSLFYRQPNKGDKEPLRPLYMFYKKLKMLITKKEQGGDRKESRGQSVNSTGSQGGRSLNYSNAGRDNSTASSQAQPQA
jgi:hypothetical protein